MLENDNMSLIGIDKYELDTPSLILDLDIMNRNISRMTDYNKKVNVELRPHFKTHKSPIIAKKQLKAGAIGIACQKLGEAEVLVNAGIGEILVTNQIANLNKINRLIGLAKHSDIIIGIDNIENAKQISAEGLKNKIKINVALEIFAGRCGVEAGQPALTLAKNVYKLKGLTFKGLWYHKGLAHIKDYKTRRKTHLNLLQSVVETKKLLENEGLNPEIVSAGATSTYNITPEINEITDVQSGSYVFMDTTYKEIEGMELFDTALTVLATVISRPRKDTAIIDSGIKSNGFHYGVLNPPVIKDIEGIKVKKFSEEHGILELNSPSRELKVGDKIEIIPSHCCATVNLHDEYIGINNNNKVEVIWPISARGKSK